MTNSELSKQLCIKRIVLNPILGLPPEKRNVPLQPMLCNTILEACKGKRLVDRPRIIKDIVELF